MPHADGRHSGRRAAYTKLLLCGPEQAVYDWCSPPIRPGHRPPDPEVAVRRQEYLFSRIVTVYGGSQQMQLDTIAKQILRLP